MNRRRRRISNFFMALTVSILFTAGVMAISWLLVERMMGISFERTRQFLQKTGLSQLTLSEDGFYEIRTPEDFQNFWEGVATQDSSARGRLLSDIYLNDSAGMEEWGGKTPDYVSGTAQEYCGIFDGGGHTVYGLYSKNGFGLVKNNEGEIRNLTIRSSLVRGAIYSSGICYDNSAPGALISNCHFYGKVVSSYASAPVRLSGICILNEGVIENCGYAGEMSLKSSQTDTCERAGICLKNEGVVKNCYNLSFLPPGAESDSLAIADKGEKNCYMLKGSGWSASGEGQVLALDGGQSPYLEDYLNRDLISLLGRRKPRWASQAEHMREGLLERKTNSKLTGRWQRRESGEEERISPDMLRLLPTLENEVVSGMIFDMMHQKGADVGSFSFEEQKRDGAQFGLSIGYGEESVLLYAYPCPGRLSMQELWERGRERLFVREEADWNHDTFVLLQEREPGEREEKIALYQTREGEWGFLFSDEEMLYQLCLNETEGEEGRQSLEAMRHRLEKLWQESYQDAEGSADAGKFRDMENSADAGKFRDAEGSGDGDCGGEDGLLVLAFRSFCSERIPWDGMDWKDETVKAAVYEALFPEGGHLCSAEQIGGLERLEIAQGQEVQTLMDLAAFPRLTSLSVEGFGGACAERELEQMDLSRLLELNLIGCGIRDISFVEQMPHLTSLSLYNNSIEDIAPLARAKGLRELSLGWNRITDITPLAGLNHLEEAGLHWNEIEDITPLAGLENLTRLNLSGNRVQDLEPLCERTRLKGLGLAKNNITDITPLENLTKLENLSISLNQVRDIRVLQNMKDMEWLGLSWNEIEDFSPIFGMEHLFYLEAAGNPSQDIGGLYLVPDLTIGRGDADDGRTMELKWAQELLNRYESRQGILAEDLAWGDLDGDGRMDVAITGYSGEEKDEEGRITAWGQRKVYLFLQTAGEDYFPAGSVDTLGPDQGGVYGDPYMGIAISGGALVVQCYGGSNFRWADTCVYEYKEGGPKETYELSLQSFVYTSGCDWYVKDFAAGTQKKYVFPGEREEHRERLLLTEAVDSEKMTAEGQNQEAFLAELMRRDREILGLDQESYGRLDERQMPKIEEWIYRPQIDDMYYTYEIHDPLFDTKTDPGEVLKRAARTYFSDIIEFPVPIYTSREIKESYDLLTGVELPDCFYAGKGQLGDALNPDVQLLAYNSCHEEETGGYVHVMQVFERNEEYTDWCMAASVFYHEKTDSFEVWDW